jgi:cytochrome b561
MKKEEMEKLNLDELIKKEKEAKTGAYVMSFCVIAMFLAGLVTMSLEGWAGFSFLPFAFLPIMIISIQNWKNIKKEIEIRQA